MARLGKLARAFNWMTNQPNLQLNITVATVFRQRYTIRVVQLYLWEAQHKAMAWLCKVANMDEGLPCSVDQAKGVANLVTCCALSLQPTFWRAGSCPAWIGHAAIG